MENLTIGTPKELKKRIDIYKYFDTEHTHVQRYFKKEPRSKIAVYYGDLEIGLIEDFKDEYLPPETRAVIILGSLVCRKKLSISDYSMPCISALAVSGSLKCKNMRLSGGDISVGENLIIQEYLYSVPDVYKKNLSAGTVEVKGRVEVPYIFRTNKDCPHFYIQDKELLNNTNIVKNVEADYRGADTVKYKTSNGETINVTIQHYLENIQALPVMDMFRQFQ